MPVPSEYVGVWKRTRITTRKGLDDTTTQVRWLQTSCDLFADLRVPTAVSSKSLKALRDLDLDDLTLLTKVATCRAAAEGCSPHPDSCPKLMPHYARIQARCRATDMDPCLCQPREGQTAHAPVAPFHSKMDLRDTQW